MCINVCVFFFVVVDGKFNRKYIFISSVAISSTVKVPPTTTKMVDLFIPCFFILFFIASHAHAFHQKMCCVVVSDDWEIFLLDAIDKAQKAQKKICIYRHTVGTYWIIYSKSRIIDAGCCCCCETVYEIHE